MFHHKSPLPTIKRKPNIFLTSSITDLIRLSGIPKSPIDIEVQVMNDMKKRILQDEMNDINFYDIQSVDDNKLNKTGHNFRSIHFTSDVGMIRGTKFHHKV